MTGIKEIICIFLAVFLVKYYNFVESLFLFLNRNIGLEKLGVCYHSGECVVYEEMNFITNDTQCQPIEMKTVIFVACGRVWFAF